MPKKQKATTQAVPTTQATATQTDKFWSSPVVVPPKPQPGQGKHYLMEKIKAYSPMWWDEFHRMMEGEDPDLKKVAFQEFNKLQQKLMPQQLEVESDSLAAVGVIMLPKKMLPNHSEDNTVEGELVNEEAAPSKEEIAEVQEKLDSKLPEAESENEISALSEAAPTDEENIDGFKMPVRIPRKFHDR